MAFQVVASEVATAVVFVLDLDGNLRSSGFRSSIDGVRVVDDEICALRLSTTDLIRLFHQTTELRLALENRPKHDHSVAKTQLGMCDRPVFARHNEILLKAKGLAQPFD